MLDFPSLLYKGLRILMFQLSGVYCKLPLNPKPLNLCFFVFGLWLRTWLLKPVERVSGLGFGVSRFGAFRVYDLYIEVQICIWGVAFWRF